MEQRIWFEREFELAHPADAFPEVVERVRGTPARLERRLEGVGRGVATLRPGAAWSIQEHVGHLDDLEALWAGRLDDLLTGADRLRPADLTNTATHEAHHNDAELSTLLAAFRVDRGAVVARLEALRLEDLARTALHPRLEQPMSIVDLFFFVAEHDDHHLATITRLLDRKGPMEDLRYPIGRFESNGRALSAEERTRMIDTIEAHPANMRAAVAGLSDEQLDTPYRENGWTVRQVVHHVVDSHVNSYVRFKLAMTEDTPSIRTYEEAAWAELPEARSAPVEMSLAILDALHPRWVTMLRAFTDEHFARRLQYPDRGEVSVDVLLEVYAWHCPHHEAHVTRLRERMRW